MKEYAFISISTLQFLASRLLWGTAFFGVAIALSLQVPDAYLPDLQGQEIERKVESLGGNVGFHALKLNRESNWLEDCAAGLTNGSPSQPIRSVFLRNSAIPTQVFSELKSITNLEQLFVNNCQVDDEGLAKISELEHILWLNLCDVRVAEAGLKHLKGMKRLQVLVLNETQITDAGLENLKGLTSLETLSLGNNEITDAGLNQLKGMTALKRLGLYNTKTTSEGRAMLRKALPNCKIEPEL